MASLVVENASLIVSENKKDLFELQSDESALIDRLKVDFKKVSLMAESLLSVANLPDPEGRVIYRHTHKNGLKIVNKLVPFGTILIIYESRPDVTVEAAASALKAGNRVLLKGGKEARSTNICLAALWKRALELNGVDSNYIKYLDYDRDSTKKLIKGEIDRAHLIVPRGGEELIGFIRENSSIPVISGGKGNNFLFIHKEADFEMANKVILNGKSRIGVCNALDKVLIDNRVPNACNNIVTLIEILSNAGITVFGNSKIGQISELVSVVNEEDILGIEFLSKKIYLQLVNGTSEAVELINKFSGGHSAVIITSDKKEAERFMKDVDCAAVYHNASTRFTDGGEFGMGAEMAVSTQKLHFRGPVGVSQLVTNKWFIIGNGQTR